MSIAKVGSPVTARVPGTGATTGPASPAPAGDAGHAGHTHPVAADGFGAQGPARSAQDPARGRALGTPAPGEGATAGPVDAAATQQAQDAQRLRDIETFLAGSPTGAAAMQYIRDNNIPVQFARGGGSYWDGSRIVIDRAQATGDAALTLVHEVGHARASRTGTSGNIATQTRDQYVETMLTEEVRGTVDSIRAKRELQAGGATVTASFPLEAQYNQAYAAAEAALRARNPSATPAELRAAGEQAGYERVMQGFRNNEVVTSTNGQGYPAYYGSAWDRAHPAPAPG